MRNLWVQDSLRKSTLKNTPHFPYFPREGHFTCRRGLRGLPGGQVCSKGRAPGQGACSDGWNPHTGTHGARG